ncbi:phosphoribosyltransferase family protein [Pseudomonas borbori]|uniref:Pyrimidine operon attenuation protein / uracil phosphoribosyltransferase n=1 Tax=Pseudomonas borbori TaxID=289003 RepID=A0A1I5NWI3_9PSED|nr:phosphoribosyltransferase family protein [Pseudomonas borbori]SFP26145.1 pyrimidine operon attenuation protein / uracil phosphoribosyltransferase [Pseudomonas borbori]
MQRKSAGQRLCLYDSTELETVVHNMALQAAVLLPPGQSALVGILRRGEPLARLLQRQLAQLSGQAELPLYALKVKRYADDLRLLHAQTALTESPELAALDLSGTTLLVVDDVLYEGHSLLRTCAYLARLGAQRVRTAVLVDRCVCTQPVHADIVGVRLQIAPGDIIECNVPPYEPAFRIEVLRHGG